MTIFQNLNGSWSLVDRSIFEYLVFGKPKFNLLKTYKTYFHILTRFIWRKFDRRKILFKTSFIVYILNIVLI